VASRDNAHQAAAFVETTGLCRPRKTRDKPRMFGRRVPPMDFFEKPSIARQNRALAAQLTAQQPPATHAEAIEALRQAEAKFRGIVENAVEGIFQTTPDGHYLSANPALARIYGYDSAAELIDSIGDIEHQLYADPIRRDDFVRLMEADGVVTGFESEIYRKDGSVIWISENARAVRNSHGEIEYYEGTVVDISSRKQSETLHREKEAAQAANRAKSQFLAHMSHELRTPLNGVIGMLDLLLGTSLGQQQQRYASIARSSADLLLGLINQILDLSKIEAGKLELEHLDFELRPLIEAALEMVSPQARSKGLELTLHMSPELTLPVRGDAQRLQQVLVNLLGNAIKFTSQGRVQVRVTLETETIHQYAVRIAVEDTGIGVPTDRLDRLFRPFSQVDASTTRQFGGTGLGLAISKQLVELMGGKIGVRSQPNSGSIFWFKITLEKQCRPGNQKTMTPAGLIGSRILVVDDNATNRELLFRQLSNWRFRVDLAPDAITALRMIDRASTRGKEFSLVLLDGDMPGIDGFELARRIHTDASRRALPLVMLSSLRSQPDDLDPEALGIVDCLTKPVRQSHLFDTMIVAIKDAMRCGRDAALPAAPMMIATSMQPQSVAEQHLTQGRSTSGRQSSARLLLAEDNEINQIVALEVLAGAGFQCDVVASGRQAIQRVLVEPYDIVLMDCQMPELDGLAATQEIRRLESEGPLRLRGYRLPIIALTANAIDGDRELCLAAGMDEYLSKPLDPATLTSLLESLLQNDARTAADMRQGSNSPEEVPADPPVDFDALAGRCLGNDEFLQRLLSKVRIQLPAELTALETSIRNQNWPRAALQAHSIKGLAANISAARLHTLAEALETAAHDQNDPSASINFRTLRLEADRCLHHITGSFAIAGPGPS
jgi:PAS domain S-box-containing protein